MPSLFFDYLQGLWNLPDLARRFPWKRRSLDEELAQATSRGSLRKAFSGVELLLAGLGIVVGTGIYNSRGTFAWQLSGPSVVISYALGCIAAVCAAAIYGEFVMDFPVSGGGYTFTLLSFGELPAWITGSNLVLLYTVVMAGVAKNLTVNLQRLTSYNATFIIEIGAPGSWQLDFFAFGLVILATLILCAGSKEYRMLVSGVTLVKMAVLVVVIVACFTKADTDNLQPFSEATQGEGGAQGIFQAMAISYHAYIGYDALTNAAEEASGPGRAKNPADLPPAMMGIVIISTLIYVPMVLALVMLAPTCDLYQCCQGSVTGPPNPDVCPAVPTTTCTSLTPIYRSPSESCPFAVNLPWIPYLISVIGILAVAAGILVGLFSLARLVMVIARDWLLPPVLSSVYPRTQTPLVAQCTVGTIVAIGALIVPLDDLSILVDFSALFTIWMVCNAHMFRRYYPVNRLRYTAHGTVEEAASRRRHMAWVVGAKLPKQAHKLLVWTHMLLISGFSIALAVYFQMHGGIGTVGFVGAWAASTLLFQLTCPLEYQPALPFAIPWWLMPWLPSVCIALTIFSMASLDSGKLWVVGVWFGISFAFYFLYSLPMGYIKHAKLDFVNTEQLSVVEVTFKEGQWVTQPHGGGSGLPPTISSLASWNLPRMSTDDGASSSDFGKSPPSFASLGATPMASRLLGMGLNSNSLALRTLRPLPPRTPLAVPRGSGRFVPPSPTSQQQPSSAHSSHSQSSITSPAVSGPVQLATSASGGVQASAATTQTSSGAGVGAQMSPLGASQNGR
ncbi:hypothetical protein N2152v2_006117 [Parachlorella kessleri]